MAAPQTAPRPTGLDGVELNPEDAAFVDSSDTNAAERALGIDLDGDGDIGVSSRDLVSNPLSGGDSTGALDRGNSSGELKALDSAYAAVTAGPPVVLEGGVSGEEAETSPPPPDEQAVEAGDG